MIGVLTSLTIKEERSINTQLIHTLLILLFNTRYLQVELVIPVLLSLRYPLQPNVTMEINIKNKGDVSTIYVNRTKVLKPDIRCLFKLPLYYNFT